MTVITRLNGGLGNQLFQVAMGLAVAMAADGQLFLDDSGLTHTSKRGKATSRHLEVGNLGWELWPPALSSDRTPWWLPIARREGASASLSALSGLVNATPSFHGFSTKYVKEATVTGDLPLLIDELATKNFVYLSGHWINKLIPNLVQSELTGVLNTLPDSSPAIIELGKAIEGPNSIAVHVRRGDFFSQVASTHGVLKPDYFFRGIEKLFENGDQLIFFSDDPQWCREEFKILTNAKFVEPEKSDKALDHMLLMSKARKFVLSNSTFSWWSAWLSGTDGRNIIRPDLWVANDFSQGDKIYPSSWSTLGGDP